MRTSAKAAKATTRKAVGVDRGAGIGREAIDALVRRVDAAVSELRVGELLPS